MPDPYTDYLNLTGQGTQSDPYSDYLNLLGTNTPQAGDPYSEYLKLLESQNQSITPEPGEIDELNVRDPVGFYGSLVHGLKSGATLGYADDEYPEDMTMGEMSGLLIGELAGGLLPLGIASAATGGFGAPAAVASRMNRAYQLIGKMGKFTKRAQSVEKKLGKLDDVKDAKKIKLLNKEKNKWNSKYIKSNSRLTQLKKEYMDELIEGGASSRKLRAITKAPLLPAAAGVLGRSKKYQKAIKWVATETPLGFQGANALNRFSNSATAFATTGFLRKRGEGPFGELQMADRLAGLPKDAWMGGLFTIAGIPSMRGWKGASVLEPSAIMGIGAYSDYLTGSPNPDMPAEERLLHGLTLTAFHMIQHGFSNAYIKDKMFNALGEMGFSNPVRMAIVYENDPLNATMKKIRSGERYAYRNKKDKDDWVSITSMSGRKKGKEGEPDQNAFIEYMNLRTQEIDRVEGNTLSEARKKLHKKYDRLDFNDPKLKDDTIHRDDLDFQNKLIDEARGEDIVKMTPEMKEKEQELLLRRKAVEDVKGKPRTFTIEKVDEREVVKGKHPVIDIRKDIKGQQKWFDKELEYLETLKNENPDNPWQQFQGNNWPSRYNWMNRSERKTLRPWILRSGITYRGAKDVSPKELQERIHGNYRKDALKDTSRKVEDNFPAKIKDYKEGDTIVIPKINRHRTTADEGTGTAFDYSESQLGKIVKTNLTLKDGDRYVPVPDASTVRVRTVDLVSNKEIELNVRLGRTRPKGEDKRAYLDEISKDNRKEITKIYDEIVRIQKEEDMAVGMNEGKPGVVFDYTDGRGNFNIDSKGRPRAKKIDDIPYDVAIREFIRRSGKEEELQQYTKKLDEYIEPDITSKEFLESEAKIDPEMYNTNLFRDASTLVEGKYFKDFYEPKLYTINEKGEQVPFDLKNIGYKGEYIFDNYLEAFRKMEKIWSEPGETEFLKTITSSIKRQESGIKASSEWQDFNRKKRGVDKIFNDKEYEAWDRVALIKTLYPHAKGKGMDVGSYLDKLTYRELSRVERFISDSESRPIHENNVLTLVPDTLPAKSSLLYHRLRNVTREYLLSTAAIFEPLGWAGQKIARKLEQFSMWRTNAMGSIVFFEKGMNTYLEKHGLTLAEVNEHVQIMRDPKYAKQKESKKHKEFLEKIQAIEVAPKTAMTEAKTLENWIMTSYENFFDDMAKMLISSNSWVKTITKDGSIKTRRFVQIFDKNGKPIELVDLYKNPELHAEQVKSFLKFVKDEKFKTVLSNKLDKKGNPIEVEASRKNTVSNYEPIYSPRMITDRFMEIAGVGNDKVTRAIHDLKNRPEIRDLKVSEARKEEIARQQFNEIMNMRGPEGVYGRQWGRVAVLPTHYFLKTRDGAMSWEKNNVEVIQIKGSNHNVTKPNGEVYKKGDKITNTRGERVVIDEVVPVYETDYNVVLKKYTDGVAHSTAAAHTYGSAKYKDILWKHLSDNLSRDTGDKYYGQFATKVLKNQLFGESRTRFDTIFRPIARFSAITGLSSPVSSLKNVFLGSVQDATVFTSRELMQNMRHLLSKDMWAKEKDLTRFSGFTHIGAYDLFLSRQAFRGAGWLRKIAENAGGMQTTEAFNRIFAQSIGRFALQNHVNNLAGIKNASTKGIKDYDSRRILKDVFGFNSKEIIDMLERANIAKESGNPWEPRTTEEARARYRAQLVTQGSGDIPYVPYWMGKQWAKPLTLFYRVAYRMTDTVATNVIKPIIVDGNMVPAMKYMVGVTGTGFALFQFYDWVLGEERVNQFKSMPSNMLEYFLKAEGLGLFSNAFDAYGGAVDSYQPVVFRNTKTFIDMIVNMTSEGLRGEIGFAGKELKDGMTEIVAGYNTYKRLWDYASGDTQKKYRESRRRQSQFLDAFYPKEKLDIDYDDGSTSKTAYYRAIRDTYWIDDNKQRAKSYYAALHYLTHTIMAEQGYTAPRAKKEARGRLKRVISKMRPVPSSWRKKPGRTRKSKYHEYYTRLPKGAQEQEDGLDSLYIQKKQELYQAMRQYRKLYDTERY